MAIVFTLLSMLMVCGEDLYEKKAVTSSMEDALKTLVWYGIFNVVVLCALLIFGLDETSVMPHELILAKPVVLLNPICSYSCLFFALAAYKYVGVSVRNTFANVDGLFYILFLVTYHVLTGNAGFAARLFTPTMAIGLILILGVTDNLPLPQGLSGGKAGAAGSGTRQIGQDSAQNRYSPGYRLRVIRRSRFLRQQRADRGQHRGLHGVYCRQHAGTGDYFRFCMALSLDQE